MRATLESQITPETINTAQEAISKLTDDDVKKGAEAHIATTKATALDEFRSVAAWQDRIKSKAEAKSTAELGEK